MEALSLTWFARWFKVMKLTAVRKHPTSTARGPIFGRALSKTLLDPNRGLANRGKRAMVSSYAARASASLNTSFASAIASNVARARSRSCFGKWISLSGWYRSARRRYFWAISVAFAARVALSAP